MIDDRYPKISGARMQMKFWKLSRISIAGLLVVIALCFCAAVDSKSDEVNDFQSKLLQAQALFKGLQQDALACTSGVRSVAASSVWRAEVPKWPVVLWRMRHGFGLSQLLDEDP